MISSSSLTTQKLWTKGFDDVINVSSSLRITLVIIDVVHVVRHHFQVVWIRFWSIKNFMLKGADGNVPEGGLTKHWPDGEQMSIYDAAMKYQAEQVPLVVFAGAEYGNGSSRDWAAKGTRLLGVKAVVAESFERIHRSNLVGMGVLPLQFKDGDSIASLGLTGAETYDITGVASGVTPRMDVACKITFADGSTKDITLMARIDTANEVDYYQNGGILHYVLRSMVQEAA